MSRGRTRHGISLPAQGAGPRRHAPSRRYQACGGSSFPQVPMIYPFQHPLVSAAVSAGNVTLRPHCAWPELYGPWDMGQCRRARRVYAGERGLHRPPLSLGSGVRCYPVVQGRGRRRSVEAARGGDSRYQAELCSSTSCRGLQITAWSQGREGGY